ncbi:MAG: TetR family transcriptional regulator [Streptosporangiales bacterium]|nr:TetR family transcriptional regulator [Streptosporangiales bacterium]
MVVNARGERRRAEIVEAAGEILLHEGFGAVRHRAVAARANVPLGATTYYFKSREDLIAQGLRRMADIATSRARAVAADFTPAPLNPQPTERPPARSDGRAARGTGGAMAGAGEVADVVAGIVAASATGDDPAALLAFYERYVEAGRHPAYAEIVQEWNAELVRLIDAVLTRANAPAGEPRARLVLALTDGLLIGAIAERSPDPFAHTREALRTALPALLTITDP